MSEKRRPAEEQPPGLEHGAASLVAQDSPDDPQIGAPQEQRSRNQARESKARPRAD
ncbi:MAG: hypothetical protein AB2385_10940 [Symbiobacterium sp.]|mgnify:CR=1 FL=1|uniref:hypothetical protein n=1 Tax=Symbiobacterium sp. TaxID=1971213 RepID=UPI003464CF95